VVSTDWAKKLATGRRYSGLLYNTGILNSISPILTKITFKCCSGLAI
jgi:hypothetical protein